MATPRWSELKNDYRILETLVTVDLFSKESPYRLTGEKAQLQITQAYTERMPQRPTTMHWELWVPSSELMVSHAGAQFRVVFHFSDGDVEGEAHLYPIAGDTASLVGTTELSGLFECGMCVPEIQKERA